MPVTMNEIRVEKIFITAERHSENSSDQNNENTDVIVVLADGHKYTASFFTYDFIEKMRNKNKLTGDFLNGKYFWGKNMVLVEECSAEIINPVVKDIIDEGEFVDVFRKL
jgi:hypothetical protein